MQLSLYLFLLLLLLLLLFNLSILNLPFTFSFYHVSPSPPPLTVSPCLPQDTAEYVAYVAKDPVNQRGEQNDTFSQAASDNIDALKIPILLLNFF